MDTAPASVVIFIHLGHKAESTKKEGISIHIIFTRTLITFILEPTFIDHNYILNSTLLYIHNFMV